MGKESPLEVSKFLSKDVMFISPKGAKGQKGKNNKMIYASFCSFAPFDRKMYHPLIQTFRVAS